MAESTTEVLFVETDRLEKFCSVMREELEEVFGFVDTINEKLDELEPTWEGGLHDAFYKQYEETKQEAVAAKGKWGTTLDKFEQAATEYSQLEERLESIAASQG